MGRAGRQFARTTDEGACAGSVIGMRSVHRVPGDEVGGYTVVRTLGRGGSGAVYLVRDEGGGEAALKLVDTASAGARVRLAREVAALQALRHPAVPRVVDAELDEEEAFVVFEFIDGPSLSQRVRAHGPLGPDALAEFAATLADALEAVHAAGVVHRDVTPSNVLMGPAGPALIDFGLSHHQDDERVTQTGLVSGTAGYVAPEVIDGAEPSPASDDWGFAATLAFAATGKAPFGTGMGALSATLSGAVDPDVPLVLARALTAAPQFRPTPAQLAQSLSEPDATAVLGADAVAPTMVAPSWDEEEEEEEVEWTAQFTPLEEDEYLDELPDLPQRALPKRRAMLLAWGIALVSGAAVAPVIAAVIALAGVVVARGVESAARAVWRSRERRGVDQGGIAAQAMASPWHLLRSLVLSLPAVILAGGLAYLVGWLGWLLAPSSTNRAVWEASILALAGALVVLLLGWGPRGKEARTGAHLVAASVSRNRAWNAAWIIAGSIVVVVCVGIATAGIEPLWWPGPWHP